MLPIAWLWLGATISANSIEFPNPRKEFKLCGRSKASFVCDPDFILDRGDAEKLDQLADEFRRSTSCLCSDCRTGISLGIFIRHNLTRESAQQYPSGRDLAGMLRKRWNLGLCDDDIVIVLLTQLNVSDFSMGPAVENIFPQETAMKIIDECRIHFESGWFYQGLESVVNSFNDVLLQLQKKKKSNGLIIGVFLGLSVFLILIATAAVLLYRQARRRKERCEDIYDSIPAKNRTKFGHHKRNKQQLEKLNEPHSSGDDDDDDDDNDNENYYTNKYDLTHFQNIKESITPLQFLPIKRQLSDVAEESSEDNSTKAQSEPSSFSTSYVPEGIHRIVQVSEL